MTSGNDKRRMRRAACGVLLALGVVLAAARALPAQSIFPPPLDLATAVEKTLENNPQTRAAGAAVRQAEARVAEARAGKQPFVEFSQTVTGGNNPVFVFGARLEQGRFRSANFALEALNDPAAIVNFRSLVTARRPLFDRRQTASRVTRAELARRQSELQAESVRQQLRFEVVRNFYGALLAREMVAVSAEAVRAAEANCLKTKDLVEVGMTTDADYLAADVELADVRQQRLEAENRLAVTLAALNIALGRRPDFEFELRGELTEKFFPVETPDELWRLALENRPELGRAALAVESGREQARAVRNEKLPAVGAFGSFGYSAPAVVNGSTDYTVGVSLTYTLFDAGRRARLEQAAAAAAQAEAERDAAADRIRLEIVRAARRFQTAQAKIQVSVKAVAQGAEVLRIVQDRYKFGLTTFNEVLRAEAALVRSKHNLLAARFDYYLSYAEVLLATGRLRDVRVFE